MKVLLIQLFSGKVNRIIYPLGLAYLSTALSGHDVKVLDQGVYDSYPSAETEKTLSDFQPDAVGISLRNIRTHFFKKKGYITYHENLRQTIEIIKKTNNKAVIVVGGAGFSMFSVQILRDEPEIDFGVFLEGEQSFPQLLENINSPEKVKGIFYRNNGEIVFTGKNIPLNFELLPETKRDIVNLQDYTEIEAIGVQTKRGCGLRCIYCSYPFLSGNVIRLRSPKNVVAEIENLVKTYGVQNFTFVDNIFNVPLNHAKEICQEIINRGIKVKWSAWFSEEFMDEEFIDLIIRAGCWGIELSPDGYNNSSLKWLGKNIKTKHIHQVYHLIRKRPQIKVGYNFTTGVPGENVFNLARFILFCLKLKIFLRKNLRWINVNGLYIEPNTELEKIALKQEVISSDTDLRRLNFYRLGYGRWLLKIRESKMLG
ncbi:MAG: cobalamin B12-binding domain-containing protein [Candidatus Schekmanbacteria bacterium]|nr:cobalamin B12-binding domain-containing protein [Candidatus Schekmanbacteria bacterium]